MTSPAWLAATPGQPMLAQQVNQFLVTHPTQYLYTGVLKASQVVNGSTHTSGNGIYMAQSFTTAAGQTAIGYVSIPLTSFTAAGASLGTTTLSLYASSGSAPSGAPLVTTTVTTEYAYAASASTFTTTVIYPLPVTGLTASTQYWLVVSPAGGSGIHYGWQQSNQTSGASTSTNGTAWTAQTYGLQYQVFDQSVKEPLVATWSEAGGNWTVSTYTASTTQLKTFAEYTAGQTAAGYLQSFRTISYTSNRPLGIA